MTQHPAPRRVLIVVSAYAPAMTADMQRARLLAWELPRAGWEVEILAPDSGFQHSRYLDSDSEDFFPPNVVVHSVGQWQSRLFAGLGMRSVGWRAFVPLRAKGLELLRTGRFNLVYFSTTQFCLFLLGPYWREKTGVPYALDIHDPCYQDQRGAIATTRYPLKREISRRLQKYIESRSVGGASALVSVSPVYLDVLRNRYGSIRPEWLERQLAVMIPFGVREGDLDETRRRMIADKPESPDRPLKIVYVGAGAGIMLRAFTLICRGLAILRENNHPLVNRVRMEFYGTSTDWREGELRPFEQAAEKLGVGDLVKEFPGRVTYRRSLELLLETDGALILGVDDAGYMPSKLFSYALSGRPLLAALRRDSPVHAHFSATPGLGHAIWFEGAEESSPAELAGEVGAYLDEVGAARAFDRSDLIASHLADAIARQHAGLFDACVSK